MMDGSFFAFALIGALVGYIVGDFQRERRYRVEARNRASLAVTNRVRNSRYVGTVAAPIAGSDSNGHADGPAWALGSVRDGAARRRAVHRNNDGNRPGVAPAGRSSRGADAPPVMAGGWDFDGD